MNSIEKLKTAKKQKKLTLKQISETSGISLGTVNKIFSGGIKSVKTDTYQKLCASLGINEAGGFDLAEEKSAKVLNSSDKKRKNFSDEKIENVRGEKTEKISNEKSESACDKKGKNALNASDYGFVRCAAFSGRVRVADVNSNVKNVIENIAEADEAGATLAVFAELCVTAYSVGDLVFQETLLNAAKEGLLKIAESTARREILVFVGLPLRVDCRVYNCAAAVCKGEILGFVPKVNLPNYNEFYEKRTFCEGERAVKYIDFCGKSVPFGTNIIFKNDLMPEMRVACEICEDIWVPNSPSIEHCFAGATIIANLSASNESAGKADYRRDMVRMASSKQLCAYVYTSCGYGESTGDVVFGGHNMVYEAGRKIAESLPFKEGKLLADVDCGFLEFERSKKFHGKKVEQEYLTVNFAVKKQFGLKREYAKTPFVPYDRVRLLSRIDEVFAIQTAGLMRRVEHVGAKKLVIGLSGGLDSTLALLVCVQALKNAGRPLSDILAVTMPCFGTTARTKSNACALAEAFGCDFKEINIKNSVLSHFKDIGQNEKVTDVVYENAQARERTQVLMDLANKTGGLVIGTGDMSELALGWCTYGGDHLSMYGVNAGVPKTLVKQMVAELASNYSVEVRKILWDIVATPISPELTPADGEKIAQITEDIVGPYELHDFFLYYSIKHGFSPEKVYYLARHAFLNEYSPETLQKWLFNFINRFFNQQFKRSCLPEGPKTGALALSPRGDWRMPSDAVKSLWLDSLKRAIEREKSCGLI